MPVSIPTVHPVDPLLTNVAVGYKNEAFIADQVLPVVKVKDEKGTYFLFGREVFHRHNTKRAIGTAAETVDYDMDTSTYEGVEYCLAHPIDDRIRSQAQGPLDPDIEGTELCMQGILLDQEVRVATMLCNVNNYHATLQAIPAPKWDAANSDPIGDITLGVERVRQLVALYPNTIVIPAKVARILAWHDDIKEIVKYTMPSMLTKTIPTYVLPPYLWGMKVIVPKAIYNTANPQQDEVMQDIWCCVLLLYVNPAPAIKKPSFGYIFESQPLKTRKWREEKVHSDYVEPGFVRDEKICAVDDDGKALAGYILSAPTSEPC